MAKSNHRRDYLLPDFCLLAVHFKFMEVSCCRIRRLPPPPAPPALAVAVVPRLGLDGAAARSCRPPFAAASLPPALVSSFPADPEGLLRSPPLPPDAIAMGAVRRARRPLAALARIAVGKFGNCAYRLIAVRLEIGIWGIRHPCRDSWPTKE